MDPAQENMGGDEGERMQNYPSPSGDPPEPGSYYNNDVPTRETQQQESSSGQHQASSHGSSVEELQLAAQLGHDLAAEPMIPVTDPSIKFDEPNLRSIMPHPPDDASLRNAMPHHADDPVQVPPMPSHVQPSPLNHHIHQSLSRPNGDNTPPRKRSKVSRACDECRRKKVKCDAQSDSGDMPCSNCTRSSQRCSFSRIPQKRGPSKGYIKELAERINSIEGRLVDQSPGPVDESSRKRTFSSISGPDLPSASQRQSTTGWESESRPRTAATPERHVAPYTLHGLAPQPIALKPDIPSKTALSGLDNASAEVPGLSQPRDVDDEVFQGYLSIIHPYLPILPTNKSRLQVYLAQCSGILREAFLESLAGTLQAFPSFTAQSAGDVGLAKKMLVEWETNDDAPRTQAAHIIHLQILVLLLVEADIRPTGSSGTQRESLLGRAVGTAWSLRLHQATPMLLPDAESDVDADIYIRIRLWWSLVVLDRWNAVAAGTPTMIHRESTVVPEGLGLIIGEVPLLLIRSSKILERAAVIISGLQQPTRTTSFADHVLGSFLDDYVENFREDLPNRVDPLTYPVVHLAYWHTRLLTYLLNPSAKASDVLWPCREIVALLVSQQQLTSPFHHHFLALSILALLELAKLDKNKEEANKLLADVRNLAVSPTTWDGIIGDRVSEHLRQTSGDQGLLQQLADVAASSSTTNAAANTEKVEDPAKYRTATSYGDMGFDPRHLLAPGYFKFIWQGHAQS